MQEIAAGVSADGSSVAAGSNTGVICSTTPPGGEINTHAACGEHKEDAAAEELPANTGMNPGTTRSFLHHLRASDQAC